MKKRKRPQIATGLTAGILIDATIIRSLLVPAAVALFGRLNWWLPDPMARLLRMRPGEVAVTTEGESGR